MVLFSLRKRVVANDKETSFQLKVQVHSHFHTGSFNVFLLPIGHWWLCKLDKLQIFRDQKTVFITAKAVCNDTLCSAYFS